MITNCFVHLAFALQDMTDAEKIRALKSLIKEHLKSAGVADKIDAALSGDNRDALSREQVIDHVVRDIKNTSLNKSGTSPEKKDQTDKQTGSTSRFRCLLTVCNLTMSSESADKTTLYLVTGSGPVPPGKRFLQVSVTRGRAFLDDLVEENQATIQIHAICFGKDYTKVKKSSSYFTKQF